jgi:hypothetical protein
MNVLILTPDRVGSTLLQRLITVYMNMHEFDQPVINLHELTNGLIRYYNSRFNTEVLGKPNQGKWGYFQTLEQIVEMLASVPHYKTTRLAHYHVLARGDSRGDQTRFYQYLNDNFFVISAQRRNLLEHALSWVIYTHSKQLNVYSTEEKIRTFANIYQNQIRVDQESLIKYLNAYKRYLDWVNDNFSVASYFSYERDLPEIEQYILGLPIFSNQPRLSWQDHFGIDFSDWNQCHYLNSDISGLGQRLEQQPRLQLGWEKDAKLLPTVATAIASNLTLGDQQFLTQHSDNYRRVHQAIDSLVADKVLVTPIPIKLQTFLEKRLLIQNFSDCVRWYNDWHANSGLGEPYTDEILSAAITREIKQWHRLDAAKSAQPRIQQ